MKRQDMNSAEPNVAPDADITPQQPAFTTEPTTLTEQTTLAVQHPSADTEHITAPDTVSGAASGAACEVQAVAQLMSEAYRRAVNYNVQYSHQSPEEARQQVSSPANDMLTQRIMSSPASRVSYLDLVKLQNKDPLLAAQRWQEIRQSAIDDWKSGENHSRVLSQHQEEYAWKQANFLAVRDALTQGCEPRNGIEAELLNQMAQAQILQMHWLQVMTDRSSHDVYIEVGPSKRLNLPQVSQVQAIEQAAAMVERFNRLFLRLQRSFQDSRKLPSVTVQNAKQLNFAHQQIVMGK